MSVFNIHIASQLSGLPSATIRAWEKRYAVLTPLRAQNGHRLYSEDDIEKLKLLKRLTLKGHTISKIAKLSVLELRNILPSLPESQIENLVELRSALFLALSAYKLDIITHELDKLKNRLGPRDFSLQFIVPLFREIGNRTAKGTLSFAQEHSLSAIAQFHMGQMIAQNHLRPKKSDRLMLIASPEGELHNIGLLVSCLLCIEHGVPFIFLGENLPAASMVETIRYLRPTNVLLGVVLGHELTPHMSLQEYVKVLRSDKDENLAIHIGGNIKPWVKNDLEKQRVDHLPTLESLDQMLKNYSQL